MTRREVALELGVSERTVGTYAQSGRLSVQYVPGKTSPIADFNVEEVEKLKTELLQGGIKRGGQENLEVGSVEVSSKQGQSELSRFKDGSLKLESAKAIVPASNFPTAKFGSLEDSAPMVSIEAGHLPALAQALIDTLHLQRPHSPGEIASKIAITVAEASVLTGISERTLRAAIKAGEIPARRIGRSDRLRPGDVRAWFDRHFEQQNSS